MAETNGTTRAGRERAKAADQQRRKVADQFAARHPDQARIQRKLRAERAAALRKFGHKRNGTVETHAHAERQRSRQGALCRLHVSGAIDNDQLGAAVAIALVHERIAGDVTVKTVSLETRVDVSRLGDGTFYEALNQVRREVAYGWWRARLPGPAAPILDMIAGDVGVTEVARIYGMHKRRAKRLLIDALNLWPAAFRHARDEVDEATLAAAQAAIL